MFDANQYQLLDFGNGRKLERFGSLLFDRPSPAAEGVRPEQPELWSTADARYELSDGGASQRGRWRQRADRQELATTIRHRSTTLAIEPTPFGHVGVFPEQAANWDWIEERLVGCTEMPAILNLFAYTGGSTLAAAAAGASVTHVDASRTSVGRARNNAADSDLAEVPIRWLVEDAARYVAREVRRGKRYDGLILDPPSYGHGPKGEVWQIDEDLPRLLAACRRLLVDEPMLVLLTGHSPTWPAERLGELLVETLQLDFSRVAVGPMSLTSVSGRRLPAGDFVRWR